MSGGVAGFALQLICGALAGAMVEAACCRFARALGAGGAVIAGLLGGGIAGQLANILSPNLLAGAARNVGGFTSSALAPQAGVALAGGALLALFVMLIQRVLHQTADHG